MLNNTSSLPKLSAQGSLARSDESSTAKTDGKQGESFDSVLSRQMETDPATEKFPADSKATTDTAVDEKEQNVALPMLPDQVFKPLDTLTDQAANPLGTSLLSNQELKTALESGNKKGITNKLSATITAATDPDSEDTANPEIGGKARNKYDITITAYGSNADIPAQPGLRSVALKTTELSNSLPSAMQAPQILTQANTAPGLQHAATPASNNTVTTPLGHSAWPAEFSQKVSWISTQKNQVAELHLNPPDLGPINITLKISDNQATALFTSPHSAVRDAIENAMPKLRESLADNGIMLGQATVSDQTPRDNSSANFMNQRAHSHIMTDDTATPEPALASLPQMTTRQHKGMVDTFA